MKRLDPRWNARKGGAAFVVRRVDPAQRIDFQESICLLMSSTTGPLGTLYRCSATDTWTVQYVPFTYPHPLQTTCSADADCPDVGPCQQSTCDLMNGVCGVASRPDGEACPGGSCVSGTCMPGGTGSGGGGGGSSGAAGGPLGTGTGGHGGSAGAPGGKDGGGCGCRTASGERASKSAIFGLFWALAVLARRRAVVTSADRRSS